MTGTGDVPAGAQRPGPVSQEQDLPRWVVRCWPRSWRDAYGEEMAQTWVDGGASRRALGPLALAGLRQRVTRPSAAGGVDRGALPAGDDVAVTVGPRRLLTGLVAVATAAAICAAQLGLAWALETLPAASPDAATSDVRGGAIVALVVALPLAVAVWGEVRTRRGRHRDTGLGMVVGAAVAVLLVFVLPALVTAAS